MKPIDKLTESIRRDFFKRNGVIQPPQTPNWRVADVARYWGVSHQRVYGWVHEGKIPVHKTPGGGLRFVEAEVKAAQVNRKAE